MGLAERRGVKNFEDKAYPELKRRMDEAAGFEVPVEVDWASLGVDDYAHLYDESFPKVYFEPVITAFQSITIDDMGREALRDGLKKVIVRHSGSQDLSFEGGVLTVDHHPVTNVDYWEERRDTLQKALEKGL